MDATLVPRQTSLSPFSRPNPDQRSALTGPTDKRPHARYNCHIVLGLRSARPFLRSQDHPVVISSSPMRLLPKWHRGPPRCPANPEEKELVEQGFNLLQRHLGAERLLRATLIEPDETFFP